MDECLQKVKRELVSKNENCTHMSDGKYTIEVTNKLDYKCSLCGETHDKLEDFFVRFEVKKEVTE